MAVEIRRSDIATVTVTFENGDQMVATPDQGFLTKEEIFHDKEPDKIHWQIWWYEHATS